MPGCRPSLPALGRRPSLIAPFNLTALGLSALSNRLLMAWLVDEQTIVRVIQPGVGPEPGGQDFWDISYARDLVWIR